MAAPPQEDDFDRYARSLETLGKGRHAPTDFKVEFDGTAHDHCRVRHKDGRVLYEGAWTRLWNVGLVRR